MLVRIRLGKRKTGFVVIIICQWCLKKEKNVYIHISI